MQTGNEAVLMAPAQGRNVTMFLNVLLFGIMGDLLLRATPWGLNVSIWLGCILAAVLYLRVKDDTLANRDMRLTLGAALLFALLFLWRDSPGLKLLNGLIVFISIALAVAIAARKEIRRSLVMDYVLAAIEFLGSALVLPGSKLPGLTNWLQQRENKSLAHLPAVMRGVLIALPLLLVFGWLFYSADAFFENLVVNIFNFDPLTPLTHALIALACAWVAAAILVCCLEGPQKTIARNETFFPRPQGSIEVNVVLALIDLLFLTFVLIQLQYLFGGHAEVMSETGTTYAEYARRGFFELATVAASALILLLICVRLLEKASPSGRRFFNVLAIILVANVIIIITSSLHRMGLYVDAYGLTRLRLYTAAFTCWLGIVFFWLAVTIVRNRIRSFAYGFLLTGYVAAIILQAINPDALIMRINIERASEGKPFDAEYAALLSADGVPTLVAGLPDLRQKQRATVSSNLFSTRVALEERPLRTWTWGQGSALRALSGMQVALAEIEPDTSAPFQLARRQNAPLALQKNAQQPSPVESPQPSPTPAITGVGLRIVATIDGVDILHVKSDSLWFEHKSWKLPLDATLVNGAKWVPVWKAGNLSAPYALSPPLALTGGEAVAIKKIAGRGAVTILQQPAPDNDYTLSIQFDDGNQSGDDKYEIEILVKKGSQPPMPRATVYAEGDYSVVPLSAYQEDLWAFIAEVDKTYPFFDLKGIREDWDAAKTGLLTRAEACQSDSEFLGVARDAIGALRDSHMSLRDTKAEMPPWPKEYYPGVFFMPATQDRVVVIGSADAYAEHLTPGTVVTQIDGQDAREYLEARAEEAWAKGFSSSPQRARMYAYRTPLKGAEGTEHTLTYLSENGAGEITVRCDVEARGWPHTYNLPSGLTREGRSTFYTALPSGAGYIYLRRVDASTVPGIEKALETHPDAQGWIVDLRGNSGGGYDRTLIDLLGQIPKPVAVLIDAGCISAGETVARDLRREVEARLFGTRTAGASSSKRTWTFPTGISSVTFSTRSRWRNDREPIEYNGIEPDVEVEPNPEDVRHGLNSTILRAEGYLADAQQKDSP